MSLAAKTDERVGYDGQLVVSRSGVSFPLIWVGPAVFALEFVALVLLSVASGIAYHEYVFGTVGDIGVFCAVGVATYLYSAAVFAYRGNYSVAKLCVGWRQVRGVTVVWCTVCLLLLGLAFLLKIGPHLSRGATLSFFGVGWSFLIVWRAILARYLRRACLKGSFAGRHAVVLTDKPRALGKPYLDELKRFGYQATKLVELGESGSRAIAEVVLATRNDSRVNDVFLLMDWRDADRIENVVRQLSVIPLPVRLLPDANVARLLRQPVVDVGPIWAAELQRRPLSIEERVVKRAFDIVVAGAGLIVLLPFLALIALLVKLDSRGPVFFLQTRGGFNHRPFRILKFRTLTSLDDGPVVRQVCRNDVRLTRLGRFLRRTSIDELPQLINVLRGEMSLVGPRPHAAAHNTEYEKLIGNYAFRHHVKPGLTGLAQVNGLRGETTVESMQRRIECDLHYINNWNMWLDIKLLAKTPIIIARESKAH
jgi:Undecaprenyl-phosphate glucose phosphotransferase